jgi:uncharacterized protein with PIN domain
MEDIKFTNKKKCPYCGSNNVNYLDFAHATRTEPQYEESEAKKYTFKCEDCKKIFYYTGKL